MRSLSRKPLCLNSLFSSVDPTGPSYSLRILSISMSFLVLSLPCDICPHSPAIQTFSECNISLISFSVFAAVLFFVGLVLI